jgi:acetylornithine deacetylase
LKRMARRSRDKGPFDHGFDVPHTTIHTGVIRGGTALNIVPHECTFDFEFRYLPTDEPDALIDELQAFVRSKIEPEMRDIDPKSGFEFVLLSEIPSLDTSAETQIVGLVQELTGKHDVGKVSYGTEASQFQRAAIPTVVCGPGSIDQAHRPDEFIAVEQVQACERFLGKLLDRLTQ